MKETISNLIADLKEQLKSLFIQVQEHSFYNLIKDYYQSSSALAQKVIKYSVIIISFLLFFYIPYSGINNANTDIQIFDEHSQLAQSLIKSKTQPLKSYHTQSTFFFNKLKQNIESQLSSLQFSPEQKLTIVKTKNGLSVKIQWINLKEFNKLSSTLEKIHPQLKMVELNMSPEKKQLYFNVIFKFQYFNISTVTNKF